MPQAYRLCMGRILQFFERLSSISLAAQRLVRLDDKRNYSVSMLGILKIMIQKVFCISTDKTPGYFYKCARRQAM